MLTHFTFRQNVFVVVMDSFLHVARRSNTIVIATFEGENDEILLVEFDFAVASSHDGVLLRETMVGNGVKDRHFLQHLTYISERRRLFP